MSRGAFFVGLLISVALHVALLRVPVLTDARADRSRDRPVVASVMETEMAEATPERKPDTPESARQAESERSSEPEAPSPPPAEAEREPPARPPEDEHTPAQSEPEQEREPRDERPEPASAPPPSPVPDLAEMHEQDSASMQEHGDLTGQRDSPEAIAAPEVRIDWGRESEAIETLRRGEMQLAVLANDAAGPTITARVMRTDERWRRATLTGTPGPRFSNRLRVVDGVPAFRAARRAIGLGPRERLVVLVPTRIERMIEARTLSAAFERGLGLEQVRRFGGRFTIDSDSRLGFEITHVQPRSP